MNSHLSKLMLARFHGIRTSLSRSPARLFVNCEVGLNRIRQEAGIPDGDPDQCQKGLQHTPAVPEATFQEEALACGSQGPGGLDSCLPWTMC